MAHLSNEVHGLPWFSFRVGGIAVGVDFRCKDKNLFFCQPNKCLDDMKSQGMVGFHLITACDGVLPSFYEKFGFKKEERGMLMGL